MANQIIQSKQIIQKDLLQSTSVTKEMLVRSVISRLIQDTPAEDLEKIFRIEWNDPENKEFWQKLQSIYKTIPDDIYYKYQSLKVNEQIEITATIEI